MYRLKRRPIIPASQPDDDFIRIIKRFSLHIDLCLFTIYNYINNNIHNIYIYIYIYICGSRKIIMYNGTIEESAARTPGLTRAHKVYGAVGWV